MDNGGRIWTSLILLRIRRLGVRVPPSAPRSQAPYRDPEGAFLVPLGATLGATGTCQLPDGARVIDSEVFSRGCERARNHTFFNQPHWFVG